MSTPPYPPSRNDLTASGVPIPPQRPPGSPVLGRVALGLGAGAAVIGLLAAVAVVLMTFVPSADAVSPLWNVLGTLVGLAAIVLGIVAVATRRGRKPGAWGIGLAALGAALPMLAWAVSMVAILIGVGAVIANQ
ncbi:MULTISPECIES: hypothetical protein [Microbacterium]|uniref:hypothetical protein n=1 Tax=Microbacterium TaxID=33882 RepID=UPI0022F0AA01|nr:hypothetical protein [Streptomyces sp. MS2A]